jgi:FAD/FMN-containing dehydrogenase
VSALGESGPGAGDWHIAVRSGGHSSPGISNVANGVTVDLGMMNSSHYDNSRNLASVEPGVAWKDVYYNLLHNGNVTVTGGRDGGVGVGGFLLGGGISYYTSHNGLGCDQVVNFEVVLANGSIINANRQENYPLWRALKGGGLNFGIVTRFDLQAMPAVDLAYGQSIIASNYSDDVIDAVVEFTNRPEGLGQDHMITLYTHDTGLIKGDVTILVIRVNTQGDLNTTSFNKINAVPSLKNTWEHMSLADAANSSQSPAGTKYVMPRPKNPKILTSL